MRLLIALGYMLAVALPAAAHEYLNFDEVTAAFGMDLENTEIRTENLAPGLYNLRGAGGNIVASIGDQGVLLVDSQFPQMIPRIKNAVSDLGGDGIDFTINTHWHFDHSDGNPMLGRDGTWMVSHENSRQDLHALEIKKLKQPPKTL